MLQERTVRWVVLGMCSAAFVSCVGGEAPALELESPPDMILATVEGEYDGVSDFVRLRVTPMPGVSVGAVRAALSPPDSVLTTAAYGPSTTGAPAGTTNIVELYQPVSRLTELTWDPVLCGPAPASRGVCIGIRARNLYTSVQINRVYHQFDSLTPGASTTSLSFRSNAPADTEFGVSDAVGLISYGRLAVGGASTVTDRALRYWVWEGTTATPTATFSFSWGGTLVGLPRTPAGRVSLASGSDGPPASSPVQGNAPSGNSATGLLSRTDTSENGSVVVFQSQATNLVAGFGFAGKTHVYLRDLSSNTTTLVDRDSAGGFPASDCNSGLPSVSSDGTVVAFLSSCQLVPADTDALFDAYVADVTAGTVELASLDDNDAKANAASTFVDLSPDGNYVAFLTAATSMVDQFGILRPARPATWPYTFVRDRAAGRTARADVRNASAGVWPYGYSQNPSVATVGGQAVVAYEGIAGDIVSGDTNSKWDIFVATNLFGSPSTTRVSVTAAGAQLDGSSRQPAISADGATIAFATEAPLLGATSTTGQVYVRKVSDASTLVLASRTSTGAVGNGASTSPGLATDGRFVVFASTASNLVPGDISGRDLFTVDLGTNEASRQVVVRLNESRAFTLAGVGSGAQVSVGAPMAISGDGSYAAFGYNAPGSVVPGANGTQVLRVPTF